MAPEGLDGGSDYDYVAAFTANLEGTAEDPEEPRKEATQEPAEAGEGAAEGVTTGQAEGASTDDDPDVELPFEGEAKTFKLKALRGIIEDHAKYAPKFAEASRAVEAAAASQQRLEAAYGEMLERANARYAPYKDVDWLALSRDPSIDPDTFRQIRSDALAAHGDLEFLNNEISGRLTETKRQAEVAHAEAARAAVAELEDPAKGIKDFRSVYPKLIEFGKAHGVSDVESVIDPKLIRILHKAFLYDSGVKTVDAQVQKVVNKPTKVIRPGSAGSETAEATSLNKALKNLRTNPNDADAIASAFAASF